jgi:hypothetical protein
VTLYEVPSTQFDRLERETRALKASADEVPDRVGRVKAIAARLDKRSPAPPPARPKLTVLQGGDESS